VPPEFWRTFWVFAVFAALAFVLLLKGPLGSLVVLRTIVGDVEPASPASVDGVDLEVSVGSFLALVGYLLAIG